MARCVGAGSGVSSCQVTDLLIGDAGASSCFNIEARSS